jgi:tetratricopeptide (TPR) repeat protein
MSRWYSGFGHIHVSAVPRWRRFVFAAIIVVAATFAGGREFVAQSLVLRGDDVLRTGNRDGALRYYGRAMWLMPGLSLAYDRYGFAASMSGNRRVLEQGIAVATQRLDVAPGDVGVRWDRAICYQHLNDHESAYEDFRVLARETRGSESPNARQFSQIAYYMALRLAPSEAREFASDAGVR